MEGSGKSDRDSVPLCAGWQARLARSDPPANTVESCQGRGKKEDFLRSLHIVPVPDRSELRSKFKVHQTKTPVKVLIQARFGDRRVGLVVPVVVGERSVVPERSGY